MEMTGIAYLATTLLEVKLPSQFKGLAIVSDPLRIDPARKTTEMHRLILLQIAMKSCAITSIREDVVWRSLTSAAAFSVIFSAPSGANAATTLASEVTVPLPASWTMMLIGLGLGFAFYRLFSI